MPGWGLWIPSKHPRILSIQVFPLKIFLWSCWRCLSDYSWLHSQGRSPPLCRVG